MQWIGLLLPAAVLLLFWLLAISSREGRAIGLIDGKLAECPKKANCVCSESHATPTYYIEPFPLPEHSEEQWMARVIELIEQSGGTVQIKSNHYLSALYKSRFLGFVDDLEVRLDPQARLLHFRSASRVGHSDFGVNRKRVEQLKRQLSQSAD